MILHLFLAVAILHVTVSDVLLDCLQEPVICEPCSYIITCFRGMNGLLLAEFARLKALQQLSIVEAFLHELSGCASSGEGCCCCHKLFPLPPLQACKVKAGERREGAPGSSPAVLSSLAASGASLGRLPQA